MDHISKRVRDFLSNSNEKPPRENKLEAAINQIFYLETSQGCTLGKHTTRWRRASTTGKK